MFAYLDYQYKKAYLRMQTGGVSLAGQARMNAVVKFTSGIRKTWEVIYVLCIPLELACYTVAALFGYKVPTLGALTPMPSPQKASKQRPTAVPTPEASQTTPDAPEVAEEAPKAASGDGSPTAG